MAERYGVKVLGHYLTMRGTVVNYPTYPWETPEAAKARAKSAVSTRQGKGVWISQGQQ
jgi:hypothetical protein